MDRWEHFPHGADLGVRGRGATPAAAFAQIARAVTAAITDLDRVAPREVIEVGCEAPSLDELLFDWLDALIYAMSTRRMIFSRFELSIDENRLRARLFGEPVDRARHEPAVEVKGPTYTELGVRHEGDEWVAQCVVDV